MATSKFQIPAEFQSQLHYVDALDHRSDAEILKALQTYIPVSGSEKNIWAFWHSGVQKMPAWTLRNVCNWVRLNGPSWTVRVLNSDPESANYALKYIDQSLLPVTYVKGTMDGPSVGPHSADLLRTAALLTHGGVWIDVGCIAVRTMDDICWEQLEDPRSPFEVAAPQFFDNTIANHFVASRKGNRFIKHWHDLFVYLWQGHTNSTGIMNSPLLSTILENLQPSDALEAGFLWEWEAEPHVVMEYVAQIICWVRVSMLEEPGEQGFNGAEYYANRVLLFDGLHEAWSAEALIGWQGQDLYAVLATSLSLDPSSSEYQKAYQTVWGILATASMQKISHASSIARTAHLGTLLDKNGDIDAKEGTFFELLRYGSVHFEQVGREVRYPKTEKPKLLLKEPLLGFVE